MSRFDSIGKLNCLLIGILQNQNMPLVMVVTFTCLYADNLLIAFSDAYANSGTEKEFREPNQRTSQSAFSQRPQRRSRAKSPTKFEPREKRIRRSYFRFKNGRRFRRKYGQIQKKSEN